ncbi:C40 family peptidase [Pseudonocardia nigra]|uniref:C40 family peptidase n=1 Tax=Pseudonocardia nigra TaxID=1921578 RepID=UPI0027E2E99A|nr:NlpC/P60 family protein [Pseudonocardia nigra]
MPKHLPALATRAAIVASSTAAAALVGLLPATTASAATPALAAPVAPASAAPAAVPAAPVSVPVKPVALAAPVHKPAAPAAPTAATASAVQNALSKLGAPYRWGAEGPNAFDCSGLIQWAFKNAGISLPRTSRAQAGVGTPVAKSDLRPGDLVFFYQPVSHAGIYIGDGKIVHASNRKDPVKISEVDRMPFNSARRV